MGGAERFPNERLLEEWEEDHCVGPAEPRLYFTGFFSARRVLGRSYLICMYARFRRLLSVLTIENKLTFLGFILLSSEPVERTRRRSLEVRPYSQAVNPPR